MLEPGKSDAKKNPQSADMWSRQVTAWDREDVVSIHLILQMLHLGRTFTHLGRAPVNSAFELVF